MALLFFNAVYNILNRVVIHFRKSKPFFAEVFERSTQMIDFFTVYNQKTVVVNRDDNVGVVVFCLPFNYSAPFVLNCRKIYNSCIFNKFSLCKSIIDMLINLYFGLTENTLGNLHLPSDPNTTFDTYKAYDKAKKTLRAGEIGEASFVTDALSNRFRETEYMLNLKAEYALGNGK